MELTEGLLKSIESTFHFKCVPLKRKPTFTLYFGDEPYTERGKIKQFINPGGAKAKLLSLISEMFHQNEYWQKYKDNVVKNTGFDVDWSACIAIMPCYGPTNRFTRKEFKKELKDLRDELLKRKIFEIR